MNRTVLSRMDETIPKFSEKVLFTDADGTLTFGEFGAVSKAIGTCLACEVLGEPIKQSEENTAHWAQCADAFEVYRAYAYDRTEKGIETWPGEEPYEAELIEKWLAES